MTPIYLDFETYWSTEHSLTKMPATEYVMHPSTEIISVAYKIKNAPTVVVFGEAEVKQALRALDWSDAMAIGHNMSGFDSMILEWRCGISPHMWGCTQAMARAKYTKVCGVSLKALSNYLHLGQKGDLEATNTKGKHAKDFTPKEIEAMAVYNVQDTELCAALFKKLFPDFSSAELKLIDMTVRSLVEPMFCLDYKAAEVGLDAVRAEKKQTLLQLGDMLKVTSCETETVEEQVRVRLASAPKFSALLKSLKVAVPMKESPTNPDKQVPALAKSDQPFLELLEHENPIVAAAAAARLEIKSTLVETRLVSLIAAADACAGRVPVPLRYCGADTTGRWSGDQYNLQNLPRIARDKDGQITDKPSNALRLALRAPRGHSIVVADLSGIELRVNMFLWKVEYAMDLFKAHPGEADLYRVFAAEFYECQEDKVTKPQRQLGKVAHLGLGFGAGASTFQRVARTMGGIELKLPQAKEVVTAWRKKHDPIVKGWAKFQASIEKIKTGISCQIDPWDMCQIEHERIRLPSGRAIHYPNLRQVSENGRLEWWYGQGRHAARIFAGKGVENIVQALARDVIADHALAFQKASGLNPALMVHDELVYIVPKERADDTLEALQTIMRTPPKWWPELITWSEGDVADSYGKAK